MKKIGSISFLFLFLALGGFAQEAKVNISANVDRNEVEVGDSFIVELKVESDGSVDVDRPEFPPVQNFVLLNVNQSSARKIEFVNGKVVSKKSLIYNFELQAKKKGDMAIPRLSVVVDGKVQKAPAMRIKVVDAGTLPNRPRNQARRRGRGNSPFGGFPGFDEDPFEELLRRRPQPPKAKADTNVKLNPNEAFQIRVITDKKEAFVGEQVTANYYIYVPDNYLLRSFDTVKYPNLRGFWKEDIEMAQTLRYETVVVDGRAYNRALLASYALFPIKAGQVKLDEYKAKCDVSVSGIFGFGKARAYTKSSRSVKVKVNPLPMANVPANFSGAVGSYRINAQIDSKKIVAHQPFAYKLKIEGQGNAKNLELPSLDLPANLELFDTKQESQFFKNGRSFKEFTLYLIPREDGEIQIPELKISVFNPKSAAYEEIKSGALLVNVAPGDKPQGIQATPVAETETKKEENEAFPFAYEKDGGSILASYGSYTSLALFFVLFFNGIFYTRKELGLGSAEAKKIEKYEKRFKLLKQYIRKEQYREFGVEGTNTIYATLNMCLDDVESGMELSKVLKKLSPNLRAEIEEPLSKSLKAFQTLGFAPEEILGDLKTSKKQKEFLDQMDSALRSLIKRHEA